MKPRPFRKFVQEKERHELGLEQIAVQYLLQECMR